MKRQIFRNLLLLTITSFLLTNCKTTDDPQPVEKAILPELSTKVITEITATSANGGGMIIKNEGSNIIESGICWSLEQNPTIKDSITKQNIYSGEYKSVLRNLLPDKTYYVRAYSTNYEGTGYGSQVSFKTLPPSIPSLKTNLLKAENTTLKIGADYINVGGLKIDSKGLCWSETANPTINDNKTEISTTDFSGVISNLKSGVKYYVRAYAVNSVGIGYGTEIEVSTTIADLDGNIYHAIKIGSQTWMLENLKTKKYQDGTSIPNVTNTDTWANLNAGAWCDFTNNASYGSKYGHLYNWYAANNKLAPAGWHIPSEAEWNTLFEYLGGKSVAGGKLKEAGTANWKSPNTGATNASGFTALAGGWTYQLFFNMNADGAWWSTTESTSDSGKASSVFMYYNYESVTVEAMIKEVGLSVRCLRDN